MVLVWLTLIVIPPLMDQSVQMELVLVTKALKKLIQLV